LSEAKNLREITMGSLVTGMPNRDEIHVGYNLQLVILDLCLAISAKQYKIGA